MAKFHNKMQPINTQSNRNRQRNRQAGEEEAFDPCRDLTTAIPTNTHLRARAHTHARGTFAAT